MKHNRFFFIAKTLIPVFISYQLHRQNQDTETFKKTCVDIREAFQTLGPTYIKLGQLLSARPDFVGVPLATELRNLLDNEPVIPFEKIEQELTKAWGKEIKHIIKHIDTTPIATASIAQVHKATLHNDHIVAIKVRRPGIEDIINADLVIFKRITALLDSLFPIKGIKFSYIYKEFSEWIHNELDFQVEGRRADKFYETMANVPGVVIPKIFWNHSTDSVLVMSYLDGITANRTVATMDEQQVKTIYDVKLDFPINPDILIDHLIGAVAKQAFIDKYFHGDLHPANIILQRGNKIAFVDFGIVGTLNSEEQTQALLIMLALVDGDPQALVKIVTSLIADPLSQQDIALLHQTFADELHRLHEDENGKISLNHFVTVLMEMSQKYTFMWSSGFLLAVKTIGQVDTLCQLIGLKSSLVSLMRPHIEKAVAANLKSSLTQETIYKSLFDIINAGKRLPQTLSQLEDVINSGTIVKVPNIQIQQPTNSSLVAKGMLLGAILLIAIPVVSLPVVTTSSYRFLLTIAIPLLLFLVLAKIFRR